MIKGYKSIPPGSDEQRDLVAEAELDFELEEGGGSTKRRRITTIVACNGCREVKKSCDGARPTCSACKRKGLECVYRSHRNVTQAENAEIRRQLEARERLARDHVHIVNLLRSLPEGNAAELLRQIRSSPDISDALSSVQSHDGSPTPTTPIRPSDMKLARAVSTPTTSSFEFELMCQHQLAYPRLPPTDVAGLTSLLRANNSPWPTPPTAGVQIANLLPLAYQPIEDNQTSTPESFKIEEQTLVTNVQPPPFCDERLSLINISYWIKVPISNELAATLLSYYIMTDHQYLGIFDVDLFLQDLIDCHPRFCSSFLVSSILYLASEKYVSVNPQVFVLRHAFQQEAEMLWNGEAANDSIVSVAGLILFSGATLWDTNESLGMEVSAAARYMSERLGLYGVKSQGPSPKAQALCQQSPEWARAASHIAWGSYNWEVILSLWYHHEHILFPPTLPIPGEGRTAGSCDTPPRHTPRTFPPTCRLWTVASEMLGVYVSGTHASIQERVPLAFVQAKYAKLLAVMAAAGEDARRDDHSSTAVVTFHSMWHSVVAMLMRPFAMASRPQPLTSFSAADASPKSVYTASINQLKHLLHVYYIHGSDVATHLWLNPGQLTLCLAVLENLQDPLWKHYFLLCLRYWRGFYYSYPIFLGEVQGFLSMALQNKAITSKEARQLRKHIEENGRHHSAPIEPMTRIMFDPSNVSINDSQLRAMATKFDDLVLVDGSTANYSAAGPSQDHRIEEQKEDRGEESNCCGVSEMSLV